MALSVHYVCCLAKTGEFLDCFTFVYKGAHRMSTALREIESFRGLITKWIADYIPTVLVSGHTSRLPFTSFSTHLYHHCGHNTPIEDLLIKNIEV